MSFDAWWKDYCRNHDNTPSFGTVFEAGRAESEAQIAALKSQLNESEMHRHELMERLQGGVAEIAALKSEREELRKALREGLRCVHGLLEEKSNDDLTTRPFLIGCQLWFREKSFLVSTPASGEPARKP